MEKEKDYKAGDICFYDKGEDRLIIVPFKERNVQQYPYSKFVPIGVVVIPSSHDVYGTGQCAVMSLKEMNYDISDEDAASHHYILFGYDCVDTHLTDLNIAIITGTTNSNTTEAMDTATVSYLPSDKFNGSQCPTDSLAKYYNFLSASGYFTSPSPYLADGSRNPVYYQTESPSSEANCLSDFDGVGNTKILSDWKLDNTIIGQSCVEHFPAACRCGRYHTEGTKQGDWYLPAEGELGYMMVRLKTINETIRNLINTYGRDVGVSVSTSNLYWSSSEHSNSYGYARIIDTKYGSVDLSRHTNHNYARAFLRV